MTTTILRPSSASSAPQSTNGENGNTITNHAIEFAKRVRVLAIDPGPVQSGFIVLERGIVEAGKIDNEKLRYRLREHSFGSPNFCAIEMIASYGMPVGREVFETCVWIGRFLERAGIQTHLVYRKDVKMHLCGSSKAKDANIRQALIDKYGPPGTKKNPGKTFGISGDMWAALAVADYALETFDPFE